MKHLYTYGLSLLVASSLAMATSITTTAPGYKTASQITLNIEGTLSGDQDWVGIYKKGSNNDWNNVLGWSWVNNKTEGLTIDTIIDNGGYSGRDILVDGGDFEARLFYHNSYTVEASTPFYMIRAGRPNFMIVPKPFYVGDTIEVEVNTILSGDQDWVGIYPKNSDNSWGNVIAWNWVESNGIVAIDKLRAGKKMLAGDYEIRLFFHNEYGTNAVARASSGFSLGDRAVNNNVYGEPGPYIDEVNKNAEEHGDYFVYYPRNHVEGAPLVLVSGYKNVHGYSGLMQYLASKGCYVVGHKTRTNEGWADTEFRIESFDKALVNAETLGVDTSRLITMGSSTGGMVAYKIMQYFQGKGKGTKKSFIIDLQGYYASGMTKDDLNSLKTDSLIIQVGGDTSIQDGSLDQDPRTLLTISKLLNDNSKKSFIVLPNTNHSYASGKYVDILNKQGLIKPIDAMLKYEFFNIDGKYNDAKTLLFDNYTETIHRVYNATMAKIGNKKPLETGYDFPCVNPWKTSNLKFDPAIEPYGKPFEATIDYCNDHGLQ